MDSKEMNKRKEKLNEISFDGMEDIQAGDVLHYLLDVNPSTKSGIMSIVRMILRISLCSSYDFEVVGIPKTIALCSNSYRGRMDHKKAFDSVIALLNNYVKISFSTYRIDLSGGKHLFKVLSWNRQIRKVIPNFGKRMLFLSELFRAYVDYKYFESLCKKFDWQIDNLITYCDVMPVDCFFTQAFNLEQKKTITLHHGFFNKETNAWAYLGSKSKYFLADSMAAVKDAKSIGYEGNMQAVGSPHYLGQRDYKMPSQFNTETVGVVMNSSMQPLEDNVGMILEVQDYCKKHQKKMILKYHPSNNSEDYAKYIDTDITITYGREISIEQFGDMVDVAVVSASTVFTAMLKQWVPAFLYVRKDYDPNLFSGTDSLKFSTSDEFENLVSKIDKEDYKRELLKIREFFLASGDFKQNYKDVFREIGVL